MTWLKQTENDLAGETRHLERAPGRQGATSLDP